MRCGGRRKVILHGGGNRSCGLRSREYGTLRLWLWLLRRPLCTSGRGGRDRRRLVENLLRNAVVALGALRRA
jgi:hypothetical protein